jgi:16S rRNA (adenine1518-N6/adenine1519-N6)-dimethyltransferase
LTPKKAFGQNFLVNEGVIRTILRAALEPGVPRVLEIGPGASALTGGLVADGRDFWAVDLDPEAIALNEARYGHLDHVHFILGDAVTAPLPLDQPLSIVGNLPYNAATPILTRFLLDPVPWARMVLMFQLEVGQKLMGKPSEKAYGPLSILAQLSTRMTRLAKLGPGSFNPPPKVDSIVLQFDPRPDALPLARRKALLDLLHRSFAQRRKTLYNNWQGWLGAEAARAMLEAEGLPPTIRAEALEPARWISLLDRVESIRS